MLNPVPKEYQKGYCGCYENPTDSRDITLGDIAYVPDKNCPSFEDGFDVEKSIRIRFKREHQGSSLSCCGQGWAKYAEAIDIIEMIENSFVKEYDRKPNRQEFYEFAKLETTNKEVLQLLKDLSAKDIYSQIYLLPDGGAFIRSGADIVVNKGVCEETFIPSYPEKTRYNTGNPDEDFMREKKQTPESIKNASTYKSRKYVALPTLFPMTEQNWEDVRQIIWQFGGFVSGYGRHCIYFCGYGIDPNNGLRYIKYINSYGDDFGEDGTGKWFENYGQPLFNITFLYDQPNITSMTQEKKNLIINIHHELLCREATEQEIQSFTDKSEKQIREQVGASDERKQLIRIVNFARTFKLINNQ